MTEIGLAISVIVIFLIRIGIPLLLLVALGIVIDRWQRRLHEDAHRYDQQQLR